MKRNRLAMAFVLIILCQAVAMSRAYSAEQILLLQLDGIIGPASSDFIIRGLAKAQEQSADLVVIRMDTPGGLDTSMRDIIEAILASAVPVAVYVAPSGARAASAGTYILYASHIAAMSPATNLGAATPVQIGGSPPFLPRSADDPPADEDKPAAGEAPAEDKEKSDGEKPETEPKKTTATPKSAMERKLINDAAAYIRSLAQLRGRNAEWAEEAVAEAASLSAEEALAKNVIDIVAVDVDDLITQVNGREVKIKKTQQVLELPDPVIETLEPDWRYQLLAIITHPQIAYILMLIGIYGLFFELSNPGSLIPGVLGGICLLLALFAFQVLPINITGLALIILGLIFMIAEVFLPSFGIMGIGGIIAFVAGSLMLWDKEQSGYEIPLALIVGFTATSAIIFFLIGTMALRIRRRPPVSGDAVVIGAIGVTESEFSDEQGWIEINGESWQARCSQPLQKGQLVRVSSRDGLVLSVQPVEKDNYDA